jgi:ribose transport system substrate-binding protein
MIQRTHAVRSRRWNGAKALVAASVATSALALVTVGAAASANASSLGKYNVAFVVGAEADPFFITMNIGAEAAAAKYHVNLIWQGNPSVYSPATQEPIVLQVTAELQSLGAKSSALVVGPTDPHALEPYIADAVKDGIKAFNVDSSDANLSDVSGFITGNNTEGGQAAAIALAHSMGYTSGKTYNVVVGMSSATSSTDVARLAGFKAEIASKYPGIKVLDVGYSESSPTTAATNIHNWLTEFGQGSSKALNGIFAIDGTNGEGAAAALTAAGLACSVTKCGAGRVALIGYDAYSTNEPYLTSGVFSALIAQDPYTEGYQSVVNALSVLKTGHLPAGVQKVTTLPNVTLLPTSSKAMLAKYVYATA